MKKRSIFDELMPDDISDEAVYAIHQFLEKLFFEFDSREFYRIRRYIKKLEKESFNHEPNAY